MNDPIDNPAGGALVRAAPAGALDPTTAARRLLEGFLSGRSEHTLRAYRRDLEDFAAHLGAASIDSAAMQLLTQGPGPANALALEYRAGLQARGLAAATVNRRLAALRSLVKLARTFGLVAWALDVEGLRSEGYRDTRGPGREGFCKLLRQLDGRSDAKGLRDRALLRMLYDLGLRRKEAIGLDWPADVDLQAGTVAVLGKGRSEKASLTLPAPTRKALADWLAMRGEAPGPLFTSLDRAKKGAGRLTGSAVYAIVHGLGEAAELRARPHGLRHAAITEALDLTRGDVRAVQRFSRHKSLQTLLRYDDNRQDLGGDVARRVAEALDDAA